MTLPASWPAIETRRVVFPLAKCPKCGGRIVTVLDRAWCIRQYAYGGCGRYYVRTAAAARTLPADDGGRGE